VWAVEGVLGVCCGGVEGLLLGMGGRLRLDISSKVSGAAAVAALK
jgi:hypothetical protein